MMYNYNVYVHEKGTDFSNNDQIYSRIYCTQYQAAQYVRLLNENDVIGKHYYFINVDTANGRI